MKKLELSDKEIRREENEQNARFWAAEAEKRKKLREQKKKKQDKEDQKNNSIKSNIHDDIYDVKIGYTYCISDKRLSNLFLLKTESYKRNQLTINYVFNTILFWHISSPKINSSYRKNIHHVYELTSMYLSLEKIGEPVHINSDKELAQSVSRFTACVEHNFKLYEDGLDIDSQDRRHLKPEGLYLINPDVIYKINTESILFTVIDLYQYRGRPSGSAEFIEEIAPIRYESITKNRILNSRQERLMAFGELSITGQKETHLCLVPIYVLLNIHYGYDHDV